MKKIMALIRPERLSDVHDALNELSIGGMFISAIEGVGQQEGHTERYRGHAYDIDYIPKVRVEVLIEDERVDECSQAIMHAARTGEIGDGKIIISPIEKIIHIRTGEEDSMSISY